ncbi:MAG: tetratricopeptide repeat protein [Myxococcales bacterium]|nr:tetratricopeptide repeat protein [Myxococcales bacterium]
MDEQVLQNIVKFNKRVKRDQYAKVYAPLGDGYRQVSLIDEALQTCQTGLGIFPRYLSCHEVLGKIYLKQNKLSDARRELEKVHAVIGENLQLRKALAKVYAKSGDEEKARFMLDWVIEKDPFDFEMRNIRAQLLREAERKKNRQEAADRGENPDAVDIYELAQKPAVVDIRAIVSNETAAPFDRQAIEKATDSALDNLEGIEVEIDAEADRLFQAAAELEEEKKDEPEKKPARRRGSKLREKILAKSVEEISAAAVIAQIELEISLLDEVAILCRRMLEKEPDDADLQELCAKFDQKLEEKEAELERLENINLAHGL